MYSGDTGSGLRPCHQPGQDSLLEHGLHCQAHGHTAMLNIAYRLLKQVFILIMMMIQNLIQYMTQGTAGGPDLAEPADRGLDPQHHLLQQRHGV